MICVQDLTATRPEYRQRLAVWLGLPAGATPTQILAAMHRPQAARGGILRVAADRKVTTPP